MKGKRLMCLVICCALVLSGCGGSAAPASSESSEEAESNLIPEATGSDISGGEDVLSEVTLPEVGVEDQEVTAAPQVASYRWSMTSLTDPNSSPVGVNFHSITLTDESSAAFPALAEALNTRNSEIQNALAAEVPGLQQQYNDLNPDIRSYVGMSETSNVLRGYQAFSVLNYTDEYNGTAHSNHWYTSDNFDLATGRKLTLADVFKKSDGLGQIIYNKIIADGRDFSFMQQDPVAFLQNKVNSSFHSEASANPQTSEGLTWAMTFSGVTFCFSAYELGSYAEGEAVVHLRYDEAPDFFNDTFSYGIENAPDSTCLNVPFDTPVLVDGQPLTVHEMENGDGTGQMTVTYGSQTISEEIQYLGEGACLVKSGGKVWLYVESKWDGENQMISVYSLPNLARVGQVDLGMGNGVPTDAERLRLDDQFQLLGTYIGQGTYHVGANGLPELSDPWYTIVTGYGLPNREDAAPRQITLKQATTDDEGDQLAAGTTLTLDKTDGTSHVQLLDPTGKTVTFTVDFNQQEFQQHVNGILIDDLFSGIIFAG